MGNVIIPVDQQYLSGDSVSTEKTQYELKFEKVHVNQIAQYTESDDQKTNIYPYMARIRGITYATKVFADLRLRLMQVNGDKKQMLQEYDSLRMEIGEVPVMLRSNYCNLNTLSDKYRV